jgi:oligoendopeptidase F
VARSAGFDIEGEDFWQQGMELIARRVGEFERLGGGAKASVFA